MCIWSFHMINMKLYTRMYKPIYNLLHQASLPDWDMYIMTNKKQSSIEKSQFSWKNHWGKVVHFYIIFLETQFLFSTSFVTFLTTPNFSLPNKRVNSGHVNFFILHYIYNSGSNAFMDITNIFFQTFYTMFTYGVINKSVLFVFYTIYCHKFD